MIDWAMSYAIALIWLGLPALTQPGAGQFATLGIFVALQIVGIAALGGSIGHRIVGLAVMPLREVEALAVAQGEADALAVSEADAGAERVAEGLGVALPVGVTVSVALLVGVTVSVALPVGEPVSEGVALAVALAEPAADAAAEEDAVPLLLVE